MNRRTAIRQSVLAIAALGAGAALGHPNHADPGTQTTLLHLLTEPDHLLALLGALAVAAGATGFALRPRSRRRRED